MATPSLPCVPTAARAQQSPAGPPAQRSRKPFQFRWRRSPKLVQPMRVEPKTYFANERTFLQWLQAGFTIAILSGGIMGADALV